MSKSDRDHRSCQQDIENSFYSQRRRNAYRQKIKKKDSINEQIQTSRIQKQKSQKHQISITKSIYSKIIEYFIPQTIIAKNSCPICEVQFEEKFLFNFGSCHHKFCQPCLSSFIQFKLQNHQQIICPHEGCLLKLSPQDVLYKILTPQQKQKYQKIKLHYKIAGNPNLTLCIKQKCSGIVNFSEIRITKDAQINKMEENQNKKIQQSKQNLQSNTIKLETQANTKPIVFTCNICNLQYCSLCRQPIHPFISCDKDIVKFLQKNKKFRQCGKCKKVIQKTQGCTHMTCLCGHYFCYMCGQQLAAGDHTCKVPENLTSIEKIRWQIEHKEYFYQTKNLSFHGCLYFFDLAQERPLAVRILYSFIYTLTIYPISIVAATMAMGLFLVGVLVLFTLVLLFLPLAEVCGNTQYVITRCVQQTLGFCGLFFCVVLFYPIFIIAILGQALVHLCYDQDIAGDVDIVFSHIGQGFRNVLMMPILLCSNS